MKTKKIIYVLFLIATILCAFSCGSRKVNKSIIEDKTKIEITDSSKIETINSVNVKIISCFDSDEIEVTPIDSTKEILVNGKTYKNVILTKRKVKANKVVEETKKESKREQKAIKTKVENNKSIEVKQIDKKQFNFLFLWWIWLIILILLYIYYKYKKI